MLFEKNLNITGNSFIIKDSNQVLIVEEWGEDTVRVFSSPNHNLTNNNHGIAELEKNKKANVSITEQKETIEMINNKLKVVYDGEKLTFYNGDQKILEEKSRKQSNVRRTIGIDDQVPIEDEPSSSLNISPREFKFRSEKSYEATLRFEGDYTEQLYGMGGYQEDNVNKNLGTYELMQRNSQTSIPFYVSNKHYGFIWNDASIGEASFARNEKKWTSKNTECIDYIVTVGGNPKDILSNLTEMTGKSPEMDTDLLGLWQSKLRYQTLDELKEVHKGYEERNIDLSVLVIDYFHWTADGDFEFDMRYWDGIEDWAKELLEQDTKLMVSLWPTVTDESKYYEKYKNNQMLLRSVNEKHNMFGPKEIMDFSNPLTAEHLEELLDKNYREKGINLFWADQAEPEMTYYNHDEYLMYVGSLEKHGNQYPYHYVRAVQPSEEEHSNQQAPVLIRSAWFNSQKHGALVWSGDIESSFKSLKEQIQIGISMGLSGVSWWTSDIAGFHSGDSTTKSFKNLMIRWFQFAVFSPILRMHGDRQPHTQRIGEDGGGVRTSGGPNEIWSFGEEVEEVLTKFISIREGLKEYTSSLYEESSKSGYPLIRSLFFEFPDDPTAWEESLNYMFGSELLIAPIVEEGIKELDVYLPKGFNWINVFTNEKYEGGATYKIQVELDEFPVFCKEGSFLEQDLETIFQK